MAEIHDLGDVWILLTRDYNLKFECYFATNVSDVSDLSHTRDVGWSARAHLIRVCVIFFLGLRQRKGF